MTALLGSLGIFFIANIPLAFALGIASLLWLSLRHDIPTVIAFHRMFNGLNSFPLLAIPFFMLAGQFMSFGGITRRLVQLSEAFVGNLRGGLAHITVVASMFFAGITGSGAAEASAIGSLMIPSMVEEGYDVRFAVSVVTCASFIGVIIPPSIPMIIYGVSTEVSIGALLLSGIIPGILLGFSLMITAFFISRKRGYGRHRKVTFPEAVHSVKISLLPLGTIVVIVGGIYSGLLTPTEAAVAATFYTFILAFLIYKEAKLTNLRSIFIITGISSTIGLFLLANATVFSWIISVEKLPQAIIEFLFGLTSNKAIILILVNLFLLVVGCLIDTITAIVILAPILHPIGMALHMDPIHFGLMVVLNLSIGMATPPVGITLFVSCAIGKVSISEVTKSLLPFLISCFLVLALIIFIPELSTFIPRLMLR
jgi:C4-dicarboxylate transporter, DctM subunit